MNDYKELVERLRMARYMDQEAKPIEWEAADAIENLLYDIHSRKTVIEGLRYLNGELAKASVEKEEKIHQLEAEVKRLNNENFWLCKEG